MTDKKVSISIREISTGKYYKIPVLPEEIAYSFGDATKDSVTVIGLGAVDFHNGNDLDSFGWSSFFPARYDASYCATAQLLTTLEYQALFERWKTTGVALRVICPAAGINKTMALYSFKPVFRGAEMDLYYSLEFREKRTIKPVKVTPGVTLSKKNSKKDKRNRESAAKKTKPGTYTVKSGDVLIRIAKAHDVTPWRTLYDKNKKVIGPNPNTLRAGQVLKI